MKNNVSWKANYEEVLRKYNLILKQNKKLIRENIKLKKKINKALNLKPGSYEIY